MKISARNSWKGTIKAISLGGIHCEITVELPGGIEVVSIITRKSADRMDLAVGKSVYALVKSSSVLLATDD